jgi:hypothetical protein
LKFIGRFEELLGTGRGIYFESKNTKAVLKLIHGCHEAVAGMQLKPTINYWRSIQDIKSHSIFKKKSSPLEIKLR